MTTSRTPDSSSLVTEYSYASYIDAHFLRLAYADEFMTMVGGEWMTVESVDNVPGQQLGGISYASNGQEERLVRVGTALCHIIKNEQSLVVRAAASNRTDARRAIAEIKESLPETEVVSARCPRGSGGGCGVGLPSSPGPSPMSRGRSCSTTTLARPRAALAKLSAWRGGPPAGGPSHPLAWRTRHRQDQRHPHPRRRVAILGRVPVHHRS